MHPQHPKVFIISPPFSHLCTHIPVLDFLFFLENASPVPTEAPGETLIAAASETSPQSGTLRIFLSPSERDDGGGNGRETRE